MQIAVADQRMLILATQLSADDAKKKAWEKKTVAFDAISQVTSLFSRPKDEDFELLYSEFRYQPFWHVLAHAKYVYDRSNTYQVATNAPEVQTVTFQKTDYEVTNGHVHIAVLEHCHEEEQYEVFVDGLTGKVLDDLKRYKSFSTIVVKGAPEKQAPKGAIFVPPQARVSGIMREALSKMIKSIQADTILTEDVNVPSVDLYYRPVYAFQYRWKTKGKDAIVEIDGVTGEVRNGLRIFKEYFGKVVDRNFLFDIGADAAGIFIPGGSIAVKVAKRYIDSKKTKNK